MAGQHWVFSSNGHIIGSLAALAVALIITSHNALALDNGGIEGAAGGGKYWLAELALHEFIYDPTWSVHDAEDREVYVRYHLSQVNF